MGDWSGVVTHKSPTMYGAGNLSVWRDGSTVNYSCWANVSVRSGSKYGYHYVMEILWNGNVINWFYVKDANYPTTGTFSGSTSGNFNTNDSGTLTARYCCCGSGDGTYWHACDKGWQYSEVNSVGFSNYDPERAATNVSYGKVYSTNNTNPGNQAHVYDYLHNQVWFDWWGQSNGYPAKNEIDYFNVDCNKNNDVGAAGSKDGLTVRYRQNTRLSAYEMAKAYEMKPGDTLYCWVNTCTKGGTWLGRVYLGCITMNKRGNIYIKDTSGVKRECTTAYLKDNNR